MPSSGHRIVLPALVGAAAAWVAPAVALEGRLQALGSEAQVIIWRDKEAHTEAVDLILAGVHKTNPTLLLPLISCLAAPGTRVVTTDMGVLTHDVVVLEGEHSGCRGNIPIEALE